MKKISLLLIVTILISCNSEPKKRNDYVTFSGKIENKNSDSLKIYNKNYSKIISVNEDGSFSDTLKVESGSYRLYDGGEYAMLYLKNGFELNMTLDTKEFDESLEFSGYGSNDNNFIIDKSLLEEQLFEFDVDTMNQNDLNQKMSDIKLKIGEFISSKETEIDSALVAQSNKDVDGMIKAYKGYFGNKIALRERFPKGIESPVFTAYENHAGGANSLADYNGK